MAKKQKKLDDQFVFFDVTYDDGTKSSRRKINAAGLPMMKSMRLRSQRS